MSRPKYRWIVTPNFFETPETGLLDVAPDDAVINGPHDLPDRSLASLARIHDPIHDFVVETADDRIIPVSLAGDCCAAIPMIAGLQKKGGLSALVWIDAHGDFNTPDTSPSQFLGGMPLAMLVGRGPQEIGARYGLWPLAEKDVWLIDGRDLDPEEKIAVESSALRRTGIAGLGSLYLTRYGEELPIHIHLDLDVIRAEEAPAMNYPVEGGPTVEEVADACRSLVAMNQVVGISICGWNSSLDTDGRTKDAARRVLEELVS